MLFVTAVNTSLQASMVFSLLIDSSNERQGDDKKKTEETKINILGRPKTSSLGKIILTEGRVQTYVKLNSKFLEFDHQSLIGLHAHSCTKPILARLPPPHLARILSLSL
jgi:hypothetical protein